MIPASTPAPASAILPPAFAGFADRWPELLEQPTNDWLAWLTHKPRDPVSLILLAQDSTLKERYRLRAILLISLPHQFIEPVEAPYVRNNAYMCFVSRVPSIYLALPKLTVKCRQLLIDIMLMSLNWIEQEEPLGEFSSYERYETLQHFLIARLTNDEVRPVLDAFRPYCLYQDDYRTDRPCRFRPWFDVLMDTAVPIERKRVVDRCMREYITGQRMPPARFGITPALALREYWVGLDQLANQHRPNGRVLEDDIDFFEEQVQFVINLTTRETSTVPSLFVLGSIIKQIGLSELAATLARAFETWFQPDDREALPRNPLVVAELRRFAETYGVQWLRELLDRQVIAAHDEARRACDDEIAKVQRGQQLYNRLRANPD